MISIQFMLKTVFFGSVRFIKIIRSVQFVCWIFGSFLIRSTNPGTNNGHFHAKILHISAQKMQKQKKSESELKKIFDWILRIINFNQIRFIQTGWDSRLLRDFQFHCFHSKFWWILKQDSNWFLKSLFLKEFKWNTARLDSFDGWIYSMEIICKK